MKPPAQPWEGVLVGHFDRATGADTDMSRLRRSASGVLGLIPARSGSKGVPGKNTRLLGGKPLLAYTIESAAQARTMTRTIVSTDSPAIAALARRWGAEAPFRRPAAYAQDDSPMVDVIRHALRWLRTHEGHEPAIVVLLQPTTPFRTAAQIDTAVRLLRRRRVDAVVSVSRVPVTYHAACQYRLVQGLLRPYLGQPLVRVVSRRQLLKPTYFRDGLVYAFRSAAFWRTGSFYGERAAGCLLSDGPVVNIDTMDDWQRAEVLLRHTPCAVA